MDQLLLRRRPDTIDIMRVEGLARQMLPLSAGRGIGQLGQSNHIVIKIVEMWDQLRGHKEGCKSRAAR